MSARGQAELIVALLFSTAFSRSNTEPPCCGMSVLGPSRMNLGVTCRAKSRCFPFLVPLPRCSAIVY